MSGHRRGAQRPLRPTLGTAAAALLLLAVAACQVSKEPPKIPLDAAAASASAPATAATAGAATAGSAADSANPHTDRLAGAARAAIDLANAQYRAGKLTEALASYREAAKAAPQEPAPYFGIYMVAQKQGNRALADSALKVIQASSGLSDSAVRDVHVNTKLASPHKG